jgi:hypothetical protein
MYIIPHLIYYCIKTIQLMRTIRLLILFFAFIFTKAAFAQDSISTPQVSSKYFETVSKKANSLNEKLDKKSQKALERFQKEEQKLKRKLAKIDSLAANNVFSNAENKYKQLEEKLKGTNKLTQYIPNLDTTITSLKFLEQNSQLLSNVKDGKEKLTDALSKVKELESQLQKAENIKQFLKERRQYLKDQLNKFGFAKEFKRINKNVYYYSQQLQEYKAILKDPEKIERKAIELLTKSKLFKDFMKKNSVLASLFRMPGDPNDPSYQTSLGGLQTRTQVNSLIQNQIAAGGPNAQQSFQQNIQQAQSQIQQLKDKINKLGGGSSDAELPDFKPNNQKTKSFLQRLELGTNVQSQRGNSLLPATSDLGLSLGYRINDESVVGIGASYKIGWGDGWNNIRISQQGASIRSFIDWKLKGSFYVSGGFEMNYRNELNGMTVQTRSGIFEAEQWQQSGLVGMSKIVSIKSKFFKNTKLQLLWDVLSYRQIPRTQPIVFRIGYHLK